MASLVTFTVWPSRRQFIAKVTRYNLFEFNQAYKHAHTEAAILATSYHCEAYVTVDDKQQRCLFHPAEFKNPFSILRLIMNSGMYRAYWDFQSSSWKPLPIDSELDLNRIVARRLLPPPKNPKSL